MSDNETNAPESPADFITRMRRILPGIPEAAVLLRMPVKDAERLGLVQLANPTPETGAAKVDIDARLVRRALGAFQKGLTDALATPPTTPPEPSKAPPPGSTLPERLELAAAEWSTGAAKLREQHSREGGLVLWNHAATLQRASEELRGALGDLERVWVVGHGWVATAGSLTRAANGSTAPSALAMLREAEVLRSCADRVDMILRSDPARRVAAIAPEPENRPTPSVLYDDANAFRDRGGLFLAGELDGPLADIEAQLRAAALFWGGVLAELRPADAARAAEPLRRFKEALTSAYEASSAVSDVLHFEYVDDADEE